MSDPDRKTNDPFTIDPPSSAEGLERGLRDAAEISDVMQAVLAAAIGVSTKPGLALTGVQLATHALRAAAINEEVMTNDEAADAIRFADSAFLEDTQGLSRQMAELEINQRCTQVAATKEVVERLVADSTSCLHHVMEATDSPVTWLVILHATREMALAMLKHRHPENYRELERHARVLQTVIRPRSIEVMEMPDTPMSKGGDA